MSNSTIGGWRIPFLFGLSIGPLGLYLRSKIPESPIFNATPRPLTRPLFDLWTRHRRVLLQAFMLTIQLTACVYLIVIYMPTYAVHMLGFTASDAFVASSIASFLYLVLNPIAGRLSDSIGRPNPASGIFPGAGCRCVTGLSDFDEPYNFAGADNGTRWDGYADGDVHWPRRHRLSASSFRLRSDRQGCRSAIMLLCRSLAGSRLIL